ncbi:PIN-like domain-containing protein [Sphingobium yanoikuyae]|jgi:hypothetical protein|uniref:PIN-like domain-containing protein n=1 Tax=Sphingobium yanoikuyae TaxID=13690 RepID=UPI0035C8465D
MSEAKPQQNQERQKARNADVSVDDAFWLTDLYPDPLALISHNIVDLADVTPDCIVVLDGNILLWPYEYSTSSLKAVEDVYSKLAKEGRLIVPAQSIREYYKHRSNKVAAISEKIDGVSKRQNFQVFDKISILEDDNDYIEARKLASEIVNIGKNISEKLNKINKRLKDGIGSDPVSIIYREAFEDCIFEIPLQPADRQELLLDAKRRSRLGIAPGFKDDGKADGGVGDLIIWKTLIQEAKTRKRHAILVTDESKNDWWVRSNGAYHPRPELIEEFRRETEGLTLHMVPLSGLLAAFKSPTAVVEQARRLEKKANNVIEQILTDSPKTTNVLMRRTRDRIKERIRALEAEISLLQYQRDETISRTDIADFDKADRINTLSNEIRKSHRELGKLNGLIHEHEMALDKSAPISRSSGFDETYEQLFGKSFSLRGNGGDGEDD